MGSDYDAAEFIDGDLQAHKASLAAAPAAQDVRAPTREETDAKVAATQQRLMELKRAQEALERQRASLEETRRRQQELQTGRQELIQSLTRGIGLLEEAEFNCRRDAEQMGKALGALREALAKIEVIHEETWTKDNLEIELTRALTALENARMEWNSARLKFGVLSGPAPATTPSVPAADDGALPPLAGRPFSELCRLGLALTWPLAVVSLLVLALLVALLLR